MYQFFLQFSAISGATAVALGAFGAHALKSKLMSSGYLETFHTAVAYQFYHTLALLAIGLLAMKYPSNVVHYAGYSMISGIILFSGSLYCLSMSGIKWLGAITPIGGLGFIAGWILLFVALTRL